MLGFFGMMNVQRSIMKNKIKNCKKQIAILAYNRSSGGHYVAIKYSESNKKFYVYNKNQELSSIDTWIKDNSYSPLCLITLT